MQPGLVDAAASVQKRGGERGSRARRSLLQEREDCAAAGARARAPPGTRGSRKEAGLGRRRGSRKGVWPPRALHLNP